MNITMVPKIKADGELCAKSAEVMADLEKSGLINQIDQVVTADERQPSSPGFALANQHQAEAAPFFIVETENGSTQVYTAYHRLLKEVFKQDTSESEEALEIMAQNSDLDFL